MKRLAGLFLLALLLQVGILSAALAQETTPAPTPQPAPAAPAGPTVQSVNVTGFNLLGDDVRKQVNDLAAPLVGKPYDAAAVTDVVNKIGNLGWFSDVTPSQTPVEGGITLTITVVENKPISGVRFVGNTVFTDAQLQAMISTKPGVLNYTTAVQDMLAVQKAYIDAGYTRTELFPPEVLPNAAGQLELVIEIFEPKIGEITITGNTRTRERVIRRELDFHVGDVLNEKKIQESMTNLANLGIFDLQGLGYTLEPGTTVGTVRVNVVVKEQRTGMASVGVAQNNVEGLTGFINVRDINFLGTDQRVELGLRFGGEQSYNLSYFNPWLDNKRTSLDFNLYNRSLLREVTLGAANDTLPYDEDRAGVNLTLGRPINQERTLRGFIGLRADRLSGKPDNQADFDALAPDVRAAIQSLIFDQRHVRSLTPSLRLDTRYPLLKPYRGQYSNASFELAGLGGVNFQKLSGETRHYFVVKKDKNAEPNSLTAKHWVFATRLQLGTSAGMPPFLDQYLLGGADSLRGYKQDRFPGEHMVLSNNELRVPITEALDIVGFFDAGDAWGGLAADTFGDTDFTLRYSYGAGIRVTTPIGPLRLDYGFNDEGGSEFTFGVGQTF